MKTIDLHVHSNASDGTFSPSEVVRRAFNLGISAFALTDHDSVGGIEEAMKMAEELATSENSTFEVIPGIELSVMYLNTELHILGYFIDYKNPELLLELYDIVKERDNRNLLMIKRLADDGIDITLEKLQDGKEDTVITRGDFSRYLIAHGYVESTKEAFQKYLGTNTPYYVTRQYMTPEVAISLIKRSGGVAVLAHPLLYKFSDSELEDLLINLKKIGIVGMEAIYSLHTRGEEIKLKNLAKRLGLIITGGTDFHGLTKPDLEIGKGKGDLSIPYSILEDLKMF